MKRDPGICGPKQISHWIQGAPGEGARYWMKQLPSEKFLERDSTVNSPGNIPGSSRSAWVLNGGLRCCARASTACAKLIYFIDTYFLNIEYKFANVLLNQVGMLKDTNIFTQQILCVKQYSKKRKHINIKNVEKDQE